MYSETGLIIRLRKDIVGSTPTRPTKPGLGLRDFAVDGILRSSPQIIAERISERSFLSLVPSGFAVALATD